MSKSAGDRFFEEDEISLKDIFDFLAAWWKIIFLFGAGAATAAWFHLTMNPAAVSYQAQAVVAMAKVRNVSINTKGVTISSSNFSYVESPALLAERMSFPGTFSDATVRECGLGSSVELVGKLRVTANSQNQTLRLIIQRSDPEMVEKCLSAVFEMIREQQNELAQPLYGRVKDFLGRMDSLLLDTQEQKEIAGDQPAPGLAASERQSASTAAIKSIILKLVESQVIYAGKVYTSTQLIAPIYVSEVTASVNRSQTLLSWAGAGIFLGLFIALAWTFVTRFRSMPS